jgi:hypothetical protein
MNENEPTSIPKTEANKDDRLTPIPDEGSVVQVNQNILKQHGQRIGTLEILIYTIAFVALISLVGIVISVVSLVVDQEHFNNETYREQSTTLQTDIQVLQAQINSLKQ